MLDTALEEEFAVLFAPFISSYLVSFVFTLDL
jgi:hypothetical protein